jgi:hypothetical protein
MRPVLHAHTPSDPVASTFLWSSSFHEADARHQHPHLAAPDVRSPPLDYTSFQPRPLSPPAEDEPSLFGHAQRDDAPSSVDMARPGSHFLREGFGANDWGRLRPDSVASTVGVGDLDSQQVQQLFRDAQDLGRKLRESEMVRTRSAEEHEGQVMDLQTRIDEVRAARALPRSRRKS